MKKTFIIALTILTAGILFSTDRFTDNGNGTITDNSTNLIWQKCAARGSGNDCSGGGMFAMQPFTWGDALSYCKGLSLGGRTGWRLPIIEELKSIVDKSRKAPTINTVYFPGTGQANYWSCSTDVINHNYAWYVFFDDGSESYGSKTGTNYVRCVSGP